MVLYYVGSKHKALAKLGTSLASWEHRVHLPTTRENSHVGYILKIKICLDDDALNLASVGVSIHEYLIAKTFVRSERRIMLPYLAFVGEASQGAFRSGNLFRLRNRETTVKVFLFFINFHSVQIIFYLQQNFLSAEEKIMHNRGLLE